MEFYSKDNNIDKILPIINGEHKVSLRLIDWFVTNYSKKYYTCYNISSNGNQRRFKVYVDYKLKLNDLSQVGFIAQDLRPLVPEAVTGFEGDLDKGETMGVTYTTLIPVLTKAIQEQQALIKQLQKDMEILKQKVAKG